MTKKSWRNKNKEIEVQPRKFNWKSHKIFNDYDSAAKEKNILLESGNKHVKIRRCGPRGTKFKVKIGHRAKTQNEENTSKTNNTNKQENNND